ncbi:MAG: portal protein [Candidatus Andersenbacteria bacterium]
MKQLAKVHTDKLEEHKKQVEAWHQYFRQNNERYWEFYKFVCATSLTSSDVAALNTLDKPTVEFNILEAMVSRLCSDFAKQEPGFNVRAADGVSLDMLTPEFLATEDVVEGILKSMFADASNDGLQSNLNRDQLIGGFSALYCYTDYVNPHSFEQNIKWERVFDPTMTYFDPMARTSHKGDGAYCGMLIPYTKDRFIKEFGEEAARDIKFNRGDNIQGFNWSYYNQDQDIVLVAYHFEKKAKKITIYKLSNGHIVPKEQYEKLLELWEMRGLIEQPPIPLEERESEVEKIEHYLFCETKELRHSKTNFSMLPIVYVDGNSVLVKGDVSTAQSGSAADSSSGSVQQMTRPYVYHARDAQRGKNFSGQTMYAELENMVMNKFMASVESIPEDYAEAYQKPQEANILVYNAFDDKTGERLDPPQVIPRTQTPSIVESSFLNADRTIQATLGSYDAQQGIVGDNISGRAIEQGAMQADGASGPYLINFIKAWNRVAEITIDMIPKIYRTPRSLPIIGKDGKRTFQVINHPESEESVDMNYDPNSLQIKVTAGVSSEIQKQHALEMLVKLSAANEGFNAFMNTMGLETLLDNLNIRGIDHLKAQAAIFMKQQQEQAQAASQKPDPVQIEAETIKEVELAKVEQRAQQAEGELSIKAAEVAISKQKADQDFIKLLAEIEEGNQRVEIEKQKADASEAHSAVELAVNIAKVHHEQNKKDEA